MTQSNYIILDHVWEFSVSLSLMLYMQVLQEHCYKYLHDILCDIMH